MACTRDRESIACVLLGVLGMARGFRAGQAVALPDSRAPSATPTSTRRRTQRRSYMLGRRPTVADSHPTGASPHAWRARLRRGASGVAERLNPLPVHDARSDADELGRALVTTPVGHSQRAFAPAVSQIPTMGVLHRAARMPTPRTHAKSHKVAGSAEKRAAAFRAAGSRCVASDDQRTLT